MGKRPDRTRRALTVTEAVAPSNLGRMVTIKGSVARVCQEEGCWMEVTDGTTSLRMTFTDEAFTVPITLQGTVLVEGVVTEEIEGETRVPRMTASGVEIEE